MEGSVGPGQGRTQRRARQALGAVMFSGAAGLGVGRRQPRGDAGGVEMGGIVDAFEGLFALADGPWSVMDKILVALSGNKHDYMNGMGVDSPAGGAGIFGAAASFSSRSCLRPACIRAMMMIHATTPRIRYLP